jgi:hypothetical protein
MILDYMAHSERFATLVGCMDGRGQRAAARLARRLTGGNKPDTITEAGIVGLLAVDTVDPALIDGISLKVKDVSVGKHKSKGVLVWGHTECAGNPVDDQKHIQDVYVATQRVKSIVGDSVPVYGAFVVPRMFHLGWKAVELQPDKPALQSRRKRLRRPR